MHPPTDEEIKSLLIGIIADGFNRSLGALEAAGAVNIKKMKVHYTGMGSKFYDLVTEQMELTASYGISGVRRLFAENCQTPDPEEPGPAAQ